MGKNTVRKKLKIVEVGEPRGYGNNGGTLLKIKGEADSGAIIEYTCFRDTLFNLFKVGAVLDCDTKSSQNGEFVNYTIDQVYIDGEPTAGKKSAKDSSEAVAAQIVAQLWISGKLEDDSPRVVRLLSWLDEKLRVPPGVQLPLSPAAKEMAKTPAATNVQLPFKTGSEFVSWAMKKGYKLDVLKTKLKFSNPNDIKVPDIPKHLKTLGLVYK